MSTLGRLLAEATQRQKLAEVIALGRTVAQYDEPGEPQAWTIAFTMAEVEESLHEMVAEIEKLMTQPVEADQVDDALNEIGESFRHILYHIRACEYYAYLRDDLA